MRLLRVRRKVGGFLAALLVVGATQAAFAGAAQAANPLCVPIVDHQNPSIVLVLCVSAEVGNPSSVHVDVRNFEGAIVFVSDIYSPASGNHFGVGGRIPALGTLTNEIPFQVGVTVDTSGSPTTWVTVCVRDDTQETGWLCVPDNG